jgi:hypothetical protein
MARDMRRRERHPYQSLLKVFLAERVVGSTLGRGSTARVFSGRRRARARVELTEPSDPALVMGGRIRRFRGAERLGYRFAKRSTFHRETIERSSIQRAPGRSKHPPGRSSYGRFFGAV